MGDINFYNNFQLRYPSDEVHWYWDELTSKIIAESGIPTDNHHLGKILLKVLRDNPETICQIDGSTGQSYTNLQVLEKSVRCATAYRILGLQKGDVVLILGPNHLDLTIPFFAGFYNGVIVAGIDRNLRRKELSSIFITTKPKIIFCQSGKAGEIQQTLEDVELKPRIVTFDEDETYMNFTEFLDTYGGQGSVKDFKATNFDPADTIIYLLSTSGTTGVPKLAAITHKNLSIGGRLAWSNHTNFPTPTKLLFNLSPLQWQTATLMHVSATIFQVPRLQTSAELTPDHFLKLIKTYKPTFMVTSPNLMVVLLKSCQNDSQDLSCFHTMHLGGSAVSNELLKQLKAKCPNTTVTVAYGASEMATLGFHFVASSLGSVGRPAGCNKYRLVNTATNEVITEPNVPGELWMKGPTIFKRYYNNPEETAKVFSEDGWFKTGDVLYRDENDNYFFCDRQKHLLKFMNHQISPTELENVIRGHAGVLDVIVTGRPDPTVGDLAVACVVPRPGCHIKEQEIKDLVKENLSESKQLRGGVMFLKEFPLLPTGKIDSQKLKNIVNS